jgi:hypothetical protein
MRPFDRTTRLERLRDRAAPSPRAAKTGLIAIGGLAGLTAASARISALRRRSQM